MNTKDFIELQALREDLSRVTKSIESMLLDINRPQRSNQLKQKKKMLNRFIEEKKNLQLKIHRISPNN